MYTTDKETITSNFLISHNVELTEKLPSELLLFIKSGLKKIPLRFDASIRSAAIFSWRL